MLLSGAVGDPVRCLPRISAKVSAMTEAIPVQHIFGGRIEMTQNPVLITDSGRITARMNCVKARARAA